MRKYRVFVEGTNFAIREEEKQAITKFGFFATRFVEAKDSEDAEIQTVNLIRDELKSVVLNDRSDPPMIYVEEIQEIKDFGDLLIPGSGCTWYAAEDRPAAEDIERDAFWS